MDNLTKIQNGLTEALLTRYIELNKQFSDEVTYQLHTIGGRVCPMLFNQLLIQRWKEYTKGN